MQPTTEHDHRARPIRLRSWFVGILIFAALAAAVVNSAELHRFGSLVRQARPQWLIAAGLLQLSTYAAVAATWSRVLRTGGTPPPISQLQSLSVSKRLADQAVPTAGMSGNVLLVDQLTAMGVPRSISVAALLVSMTGYYIVYTLLAVTALALLWLHDEATPLLAAAVSIFVLVALAIPGLTLWLHRRGSQPMPSALLRIKAIRMLIDVVSLAPHHLIYSRTLVAKAALLNGVVFMADALTLQAMLLATGNGAPFETAFIAFIIASIAVTLGPIPLGLGSFEAVSIGMLRLLGVALEPAVAATLLLRGFTLWLPLLPGLVLTRRLLKRQTG